MKSTKSVWVAAVTSTLLLASVAAHAETKKELVQKLLTIQQSALENTARGLAESPARQLQGAAMPVIAQAVPEDKRETTAKAVEAEIHKYLDFANPILRTSTLKLSQSVVAPMFEEKFTDDELKQLITTLESPVLKKYQAMLPDISNSLLEKVVQDVRPQVDPKLQATQQAIRKILDTATGGKLSGGAPSQTAPVAKPAAPAKK